MSVSNSLQRTTGQHWGMRGFAALRALLAAFAIGWALAGCTSLDQNVGKSAVDTVPVPAAAPRTTGVDSPATREHKQLVHAFGGEYHAVATERLLDEILGKLAAASDVPGLPYRVTVLNSPIINAFALPSGRIYVTRGLLALANDESEVAAVMAHEIAHVTARHALQRAEIEKQSAVISQAANVIEDHNKSRSFQAYAQLTLASFSQQQELEADRIGVHNIARAGYDPYAAWRFLQSLGRSSTTRQSLFGQSSAEKPDMMSTHPSTPERIAQAVVEARQIGAPGVGDSGRDAYLGAIGGLAFGDDPSEGLVRGPRFVHPKLGFAFAAPEGFVLENQSVALIGVGEGGAQALRLDSVNVDQSTSLETTIASGWIDGLKTASVETLKIDDLPAATAGAQGDQWSFRLGAVRMGAKVYRLIFAARALTPAVDARFRASINSFHRLSAQDAAAAHPQRIEIVEAAAGDTPETMARRMALADRPLEQFLLLNGLDKDATLKPGAHYKIVVE
jgi:predicted Zn-dependent protease